MSTQSTGRLYPLGNIPGTHFRQRLSRPQSHSAAGRIMSMKYSNYTIGNRTRNLPVCRAVPQPTAPPGDPDMKKMRLQFTVCVRACMCVCVCERERERCCRLAHITMSTVNFKSICNNRSLAVTTQRAVHLHHGSQRRSL